MANGKALKRVRIDDLLSFSSITKNQDKTYKAYKEGKKIDVKAVERARTGNKKRRT